MHIEKKALEYLKKNKKEFLSHYFDKLQKPENKVAIFTAGASGAGKTEYALSRVEKEPNLLHIDTDTVREFFTPVGYDGTNASSFQIPASKGVNWLFDRVSKKGYAFILDTNFAEKQIAQSNIKRLLDKNYIIEICYFFRSLESSYKFAQAREQVTKRKVSFATVERTFKDSFTTVLFIKHTFKNDVILHLFDRKHGKIIENINEKEFFERLQKEMK